MYFFLTALNSEFYHSYNLSKQSLFFFNMNRCDTCNYWAKTLKLSFVPCLQGRWHCSLTYTIISTKKQQQRYCSLRSSQSLPWSFKCQGDYTNHSDRVCRPAVTWLAALVNGLDCRGNSTAPRSRPSYSFSTLCLYKQQINHANF